MMTEINKDEKIVVAKSEINVANIIVAIAILLVALGVMKFLGMSPF